MNRQQRDAAGDEGEHGHRSPQNENKNNRNQDDCGEDSFKKVQEALAPARFGSVRMRGIFVETAVAALALLVFGDAFEQVHAAEFRP